VPYSFVKAKLASKINPIWNTTFFCKNLIANLTQFRRIVPQTYKILQCAFCSWKRRHYFTFCATMSRKVKSSIVLYSSFMRPTSLYSEVMKSVMHGHCDAWLCVFTFPGKEHCHSVAVTSLVLFPSRWGYEAELAWTNTHLSTNRDQRRYYYRPTRHSTFRGGFRPYLSVSVNCHEKSTF